MLDFSAWDQNPYFSIGTYYKQKFGSRTLKIPVVTADDCPNRRGLSKMETCIFCDEWGSAAYKDNFEKSLRKQIEETREHLIKRFKNDSFLVYFQAYTNTFQGIEKLKVEFETALSYPFVKGIVVGTRPDCISQANLNMWNEYAKRTYISVELGVQSFFEEQVEFLKRGHSAQKSIAAIYKIAKACPDVDIGVHFIFGIPGETEQQLIESAKLCSDLPIQSVKLHNLHVLKNTGLEVLYKEGKFNPIGQEEFAHKCIVFLEHLKPTIAVHRLGALSSRWDELIAPEWVRYKMASRQYIVDQFHARKTFQGRLYQEQNHFALRFNTQTASPLLQI